MMTGLIGRNRLFAAVLVAGALLRADAELGYRWQSWFNDSWDYVDTAVTLSLDPTRTSGYSLYLAVLRPFHSFALVTVSQHLMGLAVAVMVYALAKHRFSCPSWLAVLMTLPVLLDGFEIQLEHLIMSDTLFLFLAMLAVMVLLWSPLRRPGPGDVTAPWWSSFWRGPWWRLSWVRCAISGALLGLSAIVRTTGLPLIPLFAVWLLLCLALSRAGWRTVVASAAVFCVTAVAPTVAYAGLYDLQHGTLNTSESTGVFLYSRVMTFADCSKMQLTPDLLSLCSAVPPDQRPIAQAYIWTPASPLNRFPAPKFSTLPNSLAQQFAIKAIEAQPLDYARVIFDDTWHSFDWPRTVFPNDATYNEYLFGYQSVSVPGGHAADGYSSSAKAYLAGGNPLTAVVNPFAGAIRVYQRYIWLPGTVYGLILLAGLAGLVLSWRRGGEGNARERSERNAGLTALLPWATSLTLIVTPAATAEFDYRYVTTAVPFACLAVAMAFGRGSGAGRRLARLRRGASVTGVSGAGVSNTGVSSAGAEPGRAPGLSSRVPGGGLGGGAADAGHDQRDFAPDAS
jgi:hypothetical protein